MSDNKYWFPSWVDVQNALKPLIFILAIIAIVLLICSCKSKQSVQHDYQFGVASNQASFNFDWFDTCTIFPFTPLDIREIPGNGNDISVGSTAPVTIMRHRQLTGSVAEKSQKNTTTRREVENVKDDNKPVHIVWGLVLACAVLILLVKCK